MRLIIPVAVLLLAGTVSAQEDTCVKAEEKYHIAWTVVADFPDAASELYKDFIRESEAKKCPDHEDLITLARSTIEVLKDVGGSNAQTSDMQMFRAELARRQAEAFDEMLSDEALMQNRLDSLEARIEAMEGARDGDL